MQRTKWLFLLVAPISLGCGSDVPQAPSPPETGIVGQVYRGPTQPVCVVEDPCEETFAALFHVYRNGAKVADFTTGPDGQFQLALGGGTYTIVPAPGAPLMFPERQTRVVAVPGDAVVTVRLDFDTGIR